MYSGPGYYFDLDHIKIVDNSGNFRYFKHLHPATGSDPQEDISNAQFMNSTFLRIIPIQDKAPALFELAQKLSA